MTRSSWKSLGFIALIGAFIFATGCEQPPADEEAPPEAPPAEEPSFPAFPAGLPSFTPCENTSPPELPEKWVASGFMQAFGATPATTGQFTFDESAGAYRFTVALVGQSAQDFLLVEDGSLYQLEGPPEAPTGCSYWGTTPFGLPSRQMVSDAAVCIGEAEILGKSQEWWKEPSTTTPGANWYWFNADENRFPFRIMPYRPLKNVGWPGVFAFSYYPSFEAVGETNLPELVEMCGAASTESDRAPLALESVVDAETAIETVLGGESAAQEELVPGIAACASPSDQPPPWPDTLQVTTLLTAVNVTFSPFPSLVRYDWSVEGLRTDMYNPWPMENKQWNLYSARLVGETGYSAYFTGETFESCAQDLPGPPVQNWMQKDECTCQANLAPNTVLNPSDENYYVMRCPLTESPTNPQVFWTWYGQTSGEPTVFMQTHSAADVGTGLNLADYYSWEPGATIDPSIYDIPSGCEGQPKQSVPTQCHNCHLPTNDERIGTEEYIPSHIPARFSGAGAP